MSMIGTNGTVIIQTNYKTFQGSAIIRFWLLNFRCFTEKFGCLLLWLCILPCQRRIIGGRVGAR